MRCNRHFLCTKNGSVLYGQTRKEKGNYVFYGQTHKKNENVFQTRKIVFIFKHKRKNLFITVKHKRGIAFLFRQKRISLLWSDKTGKKVYM